MKIYNDKSDEQLISLYVDGKNEAFDALLERHKDRLYMYIYHSVKNEDAADDIFQDTFVKAIMTIFNSLASIFNELRTTSNSNRLVVYSTSPK